MASVAQVGSHPPQFASCHENGDRWSSQLRYSTGKGSQTTTMSTISLTIQTIHRLSRLGSEGGLIVRLGN